MNEEKSTSNWFTTLLKVFGWIFLILIVFGFISGIINGASDDVKTKAESTSDVKGFVISRENFNINCRKGASADDIEKLGGEVKLTAYCGCVYDDAIAQFGPEQFMVKSKAYEESNDFTEWNDIVNSCVTKELQQ